MLILKPRDTYCKLQVLFVAVVVASGVIIIIIIIKVTLVLIVSIICVDKMW